MHDKLKKVLLLFFVLLFSQFTSAQFTFETLATASGYTDTQYLCCLIQDSSTGFVTGRNRDDNGICAFGFTLDQRNEHGQVKWSRNYSTGSSSLNSVIRAADGGYYLAGNSDTSGYCNHDQFFLIKTDQLGYPIWTKLYEDSGQYSPGYLHATSDSGVLVAFSIYTNGIHELKFTKYQKNGQVDFIKKKSYTNTSPVIFRNFLNQIYLYFPRYLSQPQVVPKLIKLSENADSINNYTLDTNGIIGLNNLIETYDKHILLIGTKIDSLSATQVTCIQKIDTLGNTIWIKKYPGFQKYRIRDIVSLTDGSFVLGGDTLDNSNFPKHAFMIKINDMGDSIWTKVFRKYSSSAIYSMAVTPDNLLLATGGFEFGYMLKTTTDGLLLSDAQANSKAISSIRIFPQPIQKVGSILITSEKEEYLTIQLLDIFGRLIQTIANSSILPGENKIEWDASEISSGIYFLKIEGENFSETKKVSVMK
jgi:Secretion system C-terminal sorting domain